MGIAVGVSIEGVVIIILVVSIVVGLKGGVNFVFANGRRGSSGEGIVIIVGGKIGGVGGISVIIGSVGSIGNEGPLNEAWNN